MSDYTSCIIEIKKKYANLVFDQIDETARNCEVEFYITPHTYVFHWNGNHLAEAEFWKNITEAVSKAEGPEDEIYSTMVYSTEYAIECGGNYLDGYSSVGLTVSHGIRYGNLECFYEDANNEPREGYEYPGWGKVEQTMWGDSE